MDSLLNAYVTWQEHTVSLTVWFSCFSFKSFSTNQTVWSFCIDINRLDWSFYVTFCVTFYHHDSINNQSNKFWSLTGFGLLFECRFKFQFVKSVRIRKYSGPHFLAFELNTERYSVSLHIQSERGKILTRITPNTDTFYAVSSLLKLEWCRTLVFNVLEIW